MLLSHFECTVGNSRTQAPLLHKLEHFDILLPEGPGGLLNGSLRSSVTSNFFLPIRTPQVRKIEIWSCFAQSIFSTDLFLNFPCQWKPVVDSPVHVYCSFQYNISYINGSRNSHCLATESSNSISPSPFKMTVPSPGPEAFSDLV